MPGLHSFVSSVEMAAAPGTVWQYLTKPRLQPGWYPAAQVTGQWPTGRATLSPGDCWEESHAHALFLRPSMRVTVLEADTPTLNLALCYDDGFNCITQELQVQTCTAGNTRIICTTTCYTRTAAGLVPSDRLAVMWRKYDAKLHCLALHLSGTAQNLPFATDTPAAAAAVAAAAPLPTCAVKLVPV